MENGIKCPAQRPLRGRKARPLGIRGFTQEREHALFADLREALQVDGISEHRRIIHLEVARMDHGSGRGVNRESSRIHDAVVRFNKLNAELSQVDGLSELDHLSLRAFQKVMFLQLILDDSHGQPGGVYRDVHLLQDVGQRTDMVLVSVRDHKALHLLDVILQIGDIRNHHVNAQHIVIGEGKSAVHHNNTVLVFEGSNVHTNLLQASQGDDLQPQAAIIHLFCFLQSKLPPYFLRQGQRLRPKRLIRRMLPAVVLSSPNRSAHVSPNPS